jgi:hypothetical protein
MTHQWYVGVPELHQVELKVGFTFIDEYVFTFVITGWSVPPMVPLHEVGELLDGQLTVTGLPMEWQVHSTAFTPMPIWHVQVVPLQCAVKVARYLLGCAALP